MHTKNLGEPRAGRFSGCYDGKKERSYMGTWGVEIFEDGFTMQVRDEFLNLMADGLAADDSTRSLEERYQKIIQDPLAASMFWMALASTQWEFGCLVDRVKKEALEAIASGIELDRWDAELKPERLAVHQALAAELDSAKPRRGARRRKGPVFVPSKTVVAPDGITSATVFENSASPKGMQVRVQLLVRGRKTGGGICAGGCSYKDIQLSWVDSRTLRVTHPAHLAFTQRESQHYCYGDVVRVEYVAQVDSSASGGVA
jgi:hypothetical protein